MSPRTIVVLGGGITGLSSAFYLSRRFPSAQIFLLEKQDRLGGWVQSERVQLPNDLGTVLVEGGPRTLRPNGKAILELINLLGLEDNIVRVSRTVPAAKVRYLYLSPSYGANATGLQMMPSLSYIRTYPLLFEIISTVIWEAFRPYNRPENISDESVDSFFSRRFGESFSRKFGSALLHGIYGADSSQISVKAAFPSLWRAEERGRGSVIRGFLASLLLGAGSTADEGEPYQLGSIQNSMRNISVYSFKDGMQTLTSSLEDYLRKQPNVTILTNAEVRAVEPWKNQTFKIMYSLGNSIDATHVVSTVPLPILSDLLDEAKVNPCLPHLRRNPSSTVGVLNLIFPCAPSEIHPEGFGYLIPRPRTGYPSTSTSTTPGILGVVFDSCSLHEQDNHIEDYYHNALQTKVTVMMGGPYVVGSLPQNLVFSENDNTVPFIRCILDELQIHLSRKLPKPVYWRYWKNEACIPTPLPGHVERMEELRAFLLERPEWDDRFAVIGAGVGGVSMADCVEAARKVGRNWI